MASTTYIDGTTVIYAAWLNDVNTVTYKGFTGYLSIATAITYADTGLLGQFASNTAGYNQFVIQNTNSGSASSSSFLASNDAGTASTNYVEMGMNSSTFTGSGSFNQAGYSYLASASTDLAIGTYGSNGIHFVVASNATDAMYISPTGFVTFPQAGGLTLPANATATTQTSTDNTTKVATTAFVQTATSAPTAVTSINGGQIAGLRNRIINGDMRVDQRNFGASQTITAGTSNLTNAYTIDRFYAACVGANVTGQRVAGSAPDQYVYQFTGAASNSVISFGQRIEATNVYDMTSQTATLSVKLANSLVMTVTWAAYYPTATDNWTGRTQIATGTFTVNSTLTKYSANIALGANITAGLAIELSVGGQTSGTWTIGDMQLELGTTATVFERRPVGLEMALCQRYYWRSLPTSLSFVGQSFTASATSSTWIAFPVFMRASPTLTKYGTWTVSACNQPTVSSVDATGFLLSTSGTGTGNISFAPTGSTTYVDALIEL